MRKDLFKLAVLATMSLFAFGCSDDDSSSSRVSASGEDSSSSSSESSESSDSSSSSSDSSCSNGQVIDGVCIVCSNGQIIDGVCVECSDGQIIDGVCVECSNGTIIDGECVESSSSSSCDGVMVNGVCVECDLDNGGQIVDGACSYESESSESCDGVMVNGVCVECDLDNGGQIVDGECVVCSGTWLNDECCTGTVVDGECIVCDDGQIINGVCISCPDGQIIDGACCTDTVVNGVCIDCSDGTIVDGECIVCSDDETFDVSKGECVSNSSSSSSGSSESSSSSSDEYDSDGCVVVSLTKQTSSSSSVKVGVADDDANEFDVKLKAADLCVKLQGSHAGHVKIKNGDNYNATIVLDNITISSSDTGSGLKFNAEDITDESVYVASEYTLKLVGESTITGGFDSNSKKVVNCESNLTVVGDGTLNVNAHYKTGIGVDDVLDMQGGNIVVNLDRTSKTTWGETDDDGNTTTDPEKGFGVKVGNTFKMSGGSLSITAVDSKTMSTGYEARGLKVDGMDTSYGNGKGSIEVSGGVIDIVSDTKAFFAGWDSSEDAVYKKGTPVPNVNISGGVINIETKLSSVDSGGHGQSSSVSRSPEGIEGKNNITISGGEIVIKSTDDAMNAGSNLTISGGKVVAWATSNDGLDSNGKMVLSGGLVIALAATSPEEAFDADSSSNISLTGGTFVGISGGSTVPGTATNASYITSNLSSPAGKTYAVTASSGNTALVAFKVPSGFSGGSSMIVMSDQFTKGSSYKLYTSPSLKLASGASWFDSSYQAILDGSATVSGSSSTSLTAGSSSSSGGGPGGGGPGGW